MKYIKIKKIKFLRKRQYSLNNFQPSGIRWYTVSSIGNSWTRFGAYLRDVSRFSQGKNSRLTKRTRFLTIGYTKKCKISPPQSLRTISRLDPYWKLSPRHIKFVIRFTHLFSFSFSYNLQPISPNCDHVRIHCTCTILSTILSFD